MIDQHPDIAAAARILIQWARTRQSTWREPSPEPIPVALAVDIPAKADTRFTRAARSLTGITRRTALVIVAATCVVAGVAAPVVWLTFRPAPAATGTVTIESNPPGAIVIIDDVEAGRTPFQQSIAAGSHRVELRYRRNRRTLDIAVVAGRQVTRRVDWAAAKPPERAVP
jgi:hypothetical protein